ncbi:MAG: nucleotidyltransferase family protein, partial [Clostridia bacterium]|nr:nucleotidyltransferase family protein [Clostridia bacterium]
ESDEDSVREFAKRRASEEYGKELVAGIEAGGSYASSAGAAIGEKRLKPNDILACEYIAAAGTAGYSPQILMIKRAGAGHGSKETEGCFASASQIRDMLLDENWQELVRPFVPESTLEILARWRSSERFVTADAFSAALCVKIRTTSPERIASLPFGGGGVGQLLYNAVTRLNSWDNIVSACTSSRYTSSRISRLMVRALAEGEKADMPDPSENELVYFKGSVPYVRVLGVSSKSSGNRGKGETGENVSFRILSELAWRCRGKAVLVTAPYDYLSKNVAEMNEGSYETGRKMLLADITAQAVYDSVLSDERRSAADRDLTEQFLRIG